MCVFCSSGVYGVCPISFLYSLSLFVITVSFFWISLLMDNVLYSSFVFTFLFFSSLYVAYVALTDSPWASIGLLSSLFFLHYVLSVLFHLAFPLSCLLPPLPEGALGVTLLCRKPISLENSLNSAELKWGPSSVFNLSGIPCVAKIFVICNNLSGMMLLLSAQKQGIVSFYLSLTGCSVHLNMIRQSQLRMYVVSRTVSPYHVYVQSWWSGTGGILILFLQPYCWVWETSTLHLFRPCHAKMT